MGEQRRKTIIFGNGAIAKLIWLGSPYIDEESGDEIIEIILQPTTAMLEYYQHLNLKKRLKNYEGYEGIARCFAIEDIIIEMNSDPTLNSMFIKSGFNWEETIFTRNDQSAHTISIQRRTIEMLRREIVSLELDRKRLISRPKQWLKEQMDMQRIYQDTVKEMRPRTLSEEEKTEDETALNGETNV